MNEVINKLKELLVWSDRIGSDEIDEINNIIKLLKEKESPCDKVLKEIHTEWGENWDLIIDFFGQETADKIDKAVGYEQ